MRFSASLSKYEKKRHNGGFRFKMAKRRREGLHTAIWKKKYTHALSHGWPAYNRHRGTFTHRQKSESLASNCFRKTRRYAPPPRPVAFDNKMINSNVVVALGVRSSHPLHHCISSRFDSLVLQCPASSFLVGFCLEPTGLSTHKVMIGGTDSHLLPARHLPRT